MRCPRCEKGCKALFPDEGHKERDKGGTAWVQVMICSKCLEEVRAKLTKRIKAAGWVDRPQKAKRAAKKMEQLPMFSDTNDTKGSP